jgi:hypothetical protein
VFDRYHIVSSRNQCEIRAGCLNVDEACLFGPFYRTNLTPFFFIETLADLEKEIAARPTPEQVAASIA